MLKLRRLRVKDSVPEIIDKDEILCEYEKCPGHFYSETNPFHNDTPLNLKIICEYLKFDDYFELIETKLIDSI